MFDISELIKTVGYLGLLLIVFAESGLFIGFFLPGDSLLFTAGFLASQGYLDMGILVFICFLGAVMGDNFGYYFGKKIGPKIFTKEDSIIFSKEHVRRAEDFYKQYGKKAIIIARFLPIVRTFAPILAGVGRMHYGTFLSYNIAGAVAWGIGLPAIGYYLGSSIPGIDKYLLPIILVIIVLSASPTLIHILKSKEHRNQVWKFIKKLFNY